MEYPAMRIIRFLTGRPAPPGQSCTAPRKGRSWIARHGGSIAAQVVAALIVAAIIALVATFL
jgi:hypothetical protein